jgi:hypothetical protein
MYLFALVMDEVTRNIQGDIPWCMMFADDIVLVDESQAGVNRKLEWKNGFCCVLDMLEYQLPCDRHMKK